MYHGERFNGGTHLMGAVLAAAGATVLVVIAARAGDPWKIVSFSIYGTLLFALYIISTLYHSTRGKVKDVFRKLDHCSIYPLAFVRARGQRQPLPRTPALCGVNRPAAQPPLEA